MKIAIHLVVDVDPKAWSEVYGMPVNEVRDDVKTYILNQIQGSAGVEESGADVTLN